MNSRFYVPGLVLVAPLLMALALVMSGCQMLAGKPQPPTPTPILLPTEESGQGQSGGDQAEVELTVPSRSRTPQTAPKRGVVSPTEQPSTPTVVSSSAAATPTPVARIMVVGLRPSVTLRASPDGGAQAVTTVSGALVLWAHALSPDGKWLLVSYDDADHTAWVPAGAVTHAV